MGHWLAEMSGSLGATIQLSDDGYCRMMSEDETVMTLVAEPATDVFRVFLDILPMPLDNHIQIYENCLKMNLDQGYTGGASIGVDLPSYSLVLSYISQVENITFIQFNNVLQNLLGVAKKIKIDLISYEQDSQPQLIREDIGFTSHILQV
jgi:hypothetical protein